MKVEHSMQLSETDNSIIIMKRETLENIVTGKISSRSGRGRREKLPGSQMMAWRNSNRTPETEICERQGHLRHLKGTCWWWCKIDILLWFFLWCIWLFYIWCFQFGWRGQWTEPVHWCTETKTQWSSEFTQGSTGRPHGLREGDLF